MPKPVNFDQLYPGRFLKSGELLGKKRTVTIATVEVDELEGEKGKKVQGVIILKETEKQIVLNKTNGLCLKGMFGKKLSDWEGKRITIYEDKVRFGADMVDAIRIWGSPDIDRDKEVIINLPRKKPTTMTMHKVAAEQAAARADIAPATNSQPSRPASARVPYTTETAIGALRSCSDDLTRGAIWNEIQSDFDARGEEVPLEVEDANNVAKERLQEI
jgi:hypothetical protein